MALGLQVAAAWLMGVPAAPVQTDRAHLPASGQTVKPACWARPGPASLRAAGIRKARAARTASRPMERRKSLEAFPFITAPPEYGVSPSIAQRGRPLGDRPL